MRGEGGVGEGVVVGEGAAADVAACAWAGAAENAIG